VCSSDLPSQPVFSAEEVTQMAQEIEAMTK